MVFPIGQQQILPKRLEETDNTPTHFLACKENNHHEMALLLLDCNKVLYAVNCEMTVKNIFAHILMNEVHAKKLFCKNNCLFSKSSLRTMANLSD